jgi:serine/threonine-protein kinase
MLKPGDKFERFTIDAFLGQGGMGSVYRAHDSRLDRRVAIKVISEEARPDGEAGARLVREAKAAAALDHPNAVSIFDVGEKDGAPYIVMELVSGRTLREAVGESSVPVATRVGWLADVARALGTAHKRGLVHRDVKPENVMVRDDGVVKVLDFGIARRAVAAADPVDARAPTQSPSLPTLTKEGVKVGTPVYMAPEQIRGDALDGRADQFAWGVLAYELLTGKPPWRGSEPLSMVASILTDEVSGEALERAGVPAEARAVIRRALSKKPDDRFASMEDLVRALEGAGRQEAPAPAAPDRAAASPSARSTQLQRYSTAEVQEVLARAVELEAAKRADIRLGFDDLVAAAREVGVEEDVLREASREIRARQAGALVPVTPAGPAGPADDAREAWLRRKRRQFFRHFGVWAIVNTALLTVNFLEHNPWDSLKVTIFWGIAVAIHALRTFTASDDDWREEREKQGKEQRKKQEKEERRKQKRSRDASPAIDEGAALLRSTGEALRARVPPGTERVRVASMDTGAAREAAAVEEAAAAEQARARQRRR